MPLDAPQYTDTRTDRLGEPIVVRSAAVSDRAAIRELISSLGETSRYFRFFQARSSLSDSELDSLLGLKSERSACVLAFIETRPGPIAFAQYAVTSGDAADIAFAVLDDWQGRGIGTILFEALADIASGCGIARFTADVMGSNVRMLEVFENAGCQVRRHWDGSSIHVEIALGDGAVFPVSRMLRSFVAWMAAAKDHGGSAAGDRARRQ